MMVVSDTTAIINLAIIGELHVYLICSRPS